MKPLVLAAKIAMVFAFLMAAVLLGTFFLFMRVAGHEVIDELGVLRIHRGLQVAHQIEGLLESQAAEGATLPDWPQWKEEPEIQARIQAAEARLPLRITIVQPGEPPGAAHTSHWGQFFLHNREIEVGGRSCFLLGPPSFAVLVPLEWRGQPVARLWIEPPEGRPELLSIFTRGLLWIGALALASVVLLAYAITRPHRRMGGAMDRIAAGELGYRVPDQGSDEVAVMGRSFNRMAERIEDMLRRQKELTAGVSHEIRSPLARMKLNLELLRDDRGDHPKIQGLEEEIDHLDELVSELLLASRIELATVPMDLQDLELEPLAHQAWRRVAPEATERGIALDIALDPESRAVHASPSLLLRALGNLFENALRHTNRRVRLVAEKQGERICLQVEDDGPGVGPEHLERLFEPFYRVDPSRSRRTGAGGLGLMIVARAVEAHGGQARAENLPGGGLSLRFDLPVPTTTISSGSSQP